MRKVGEKKKKKNEYDDWSDSNSQSREHNGSEDEGIDWLTEQLAGDSFHLKTLHPMQIPMKTR